MENASGIIRNLLLDLFANTYDYILARYPGKEATRGISTKGAVVIAIMGEEHLVLKSLLLFNFCIAVPGINHYFYS